MKLNTVERLLKMDAGKVKTPEKDVTLKLKKLNDEEFTFPCKAVDPEYISELQENSIEFYDGDIDKIKMYDTKVMTIIEGSPSIFKDKDLREHFGCATPKDLVKKLLLSGEMDDLKAEIDKLGGYDSKKKKKEKNNIKN